MDGLTGGLLPVPDRPKERQYPSHASNGPFGKGTRNHFSNMKNRTIGTMAADADRLERVLASYGNHEGEYEDPRGNINPDICR